MPYSLVSAATLGFDLVRLPGGPRVAEVLLAGLAADTPALERLAARHARVLLPDREHPGLAAWARRARELAAAVPRVGAGTAATGAPAAPADTPARAAALALLLERSTIGSAAAVERLLRDDVLGPGSPAELVDPVVRERAADVLADAAVGWWAVDVLPPLVHRQLVAAWSRSGEPVLDPASPLPGLGADLPGAAADLDELTRALATAGPDGRLRWRAAADAGRAGRRSWAAAMHDACWAAHLSGRTRVAAAAQLRAVLAFDRGGLQPRDGAEGVWNAVAGAVQATVVADLLDESSLALLLEPWALVAGRPPRVG